jgi:hypothetical protein
MTRLADEARRLRLDDRLDVPEVAARLGVHQTTVYEWLADPDGSKRRARRRRYGGTCVDCGAPTEGSGGYGKAPKRCQPCATAHQKATAPWSREVILAAFRTWIDEHGAPPTSTEWMSGPGHPTTNTVVSKFGSWSAALRAVGYEARFSGRALPLDEGRPGAGR